MLKKYRTCNPTMRITKYDFNNKLLKSYIYIYRHTHTCARDLIGLIAMLFSFWSCLLMEESDIMW